MCLRKITNTTEEPEVQGVGYKVVDKYPEGYRPLIYSGRHTEPLQLNKEATANQIAIRIEADHGEFYPPGFHICTTLIDARNLYSKYAINPINLYSKDAINYVKLPGCVIVKVKWRHKLAEGIQDNMPCIVAKYQTIISEIEPELKTELELECA